MNESFRFGHVAGIRVGAHWSVLVIAWLIAWALAEDVLPVAVPGRPGLEYWGVGLATAILFFLSLLAHELAHAVQARREGLRVEGITLWLLGGVAQLRGEAPTPGAEARIAGIGPLVSLGLGLLAGLVALGLRLTEMPPLLVAGLIWLGGINVVLGLFNLLPGAPLDGGRLLRAIVWRWRGDALRATAAASAVGRGLGFGLIGLGLFELVAGQDAGGLWSIVLGFFLVGAAGAESQQAVLTGALRGLPVRSAMDAQLLHVPAGLRVDTFISHVALTTRASAWLVVGVGGEVVGVVRTADVARIPSRERGDRRLEDVAVPISRMASAHPDEDLTAVLERQAPGSTGVLVIEDGRPVGFVGPREIADAVERARLAGRGGGAAAAGRPTQAHRPG